MSTYLYITEYACVAVQQTAGTGAPQVPQEPPLAEQVVSVTSTSAQSSAFNASTTLVRVHNDGVAAVGVTFGTNPTATVQSGGAGSGRFAANQTEYRAVQRGQSYKVAAILATQ